jgi:TetR/AcrR family transcriptional regulator, transcriptional repressor for nem operon
MTSGQSARGTLRSVPRTQPADVRRDQLLDAAERVLLKRGLRATTVADVADAAGVAKGTMYLYFRSKDDLLSGLRARYLDRYTAALDTGGSSARERLRRLVVALFDFGVAHHELHHLLFHEAGFSEADAFVGVRNRIVADVTAGMEDGEFAIDDPTLTASFVLHGVHGALVDALHLARPPARRKKAAALADLVDRVLGPA